MAERLVSPTEKRLKRDEVKAVVAKERNDLETAINEVASTHSGLRLLRHIARQSGFGQAKVVMRRTPEGEILPMEGATLYNCARESVYIDEVREYLTPSNRVKVEKNL